MLVAFIMPVWADFAPPRWHEPIWQQQSLAWVLAPYLRKASDHCSPDGAMPNDGPYLPLPAPDWSAVVDIWAHATAYDGAGKMFYAWGDVCARQQNRWAWADRIAYDHAAHRLTIMGHGCVRDSQGLEVSMDNGWVQANKIQTSAGAQASTTVSGDGDRGGTGMLKGCRLRSGTEALTADVLQLTQNVVRIGQASYTPCLGRQNGCKDRLPLWSVHAQDVVYDHTRGLIHAQDVALHVRGKSLVRVPFFTLPTRRQSGILCPLASVTSSTGGYVGVPYFWAISPSQDLTVTPFLTTGAGLLLAQEYRQKFSCHNTLRVKGAVSVTGVDNAHKNPTLGAIRLTEWTRLGQPLRGRTKDGIQGFLQVDACARWGQHWHALSQETWASHKDFFVRRPFFGHTNEPHLHSFTRVQGFYNHHSWHIQGMRYKNLQETWQEGQPGFLRQNCYVYPEVTHTWHRHLQRAGIRGVGNWGSIDTICRMAIVVNHRGQRVHKALGHVRWQSPWVTRGGVVIQPLWRGQIMTAVFDNNIKDKGKNWDETSYAVLPLPLFANKAKHNNTNDTYGAYAQAHTQAGFTVRWPWVMDMGFGQGSEPVVMGKKSVKKNEILPLHASTGALCVTPVAQIMVSTAAKNKPQGVPWVTHDAQGFVPLASTIFLPQRISGFDQFDDVSRLTWGLQLDGALPSYMPGRWYMMWAQVTPFSHKKLSSSSLMHTASLTEQPWALIENLSPLRHPYRMVHTRAESARGHVQHWVGWDLKTQKTVVHGFSAVAGALDTTQIGLTYIYFPDNAADRQGVSRTLKGVGRMKPDVHQGFVWIGFPLTDTWRMHVFCRKNFDLLGDSQTEASDAVRQKWAGRMLRKGLGFEYQNQCLAAGVRVQHTAFQTSSLRSGWGVHVYVALRNLGALQHCQTLDPWGQGDEWEK